MTDSEENSPWRGPFLFVGVPILFIAGVFVVMQQTMSPADFPTVQAREAYRQDCRTRYTNANCGGIISEFDEQCVEESQMHDVRSGGTKFDAELYQRCMRGHEP